MEESNNKILNMNRKIIIIPAFDEEDNLFPVISGIKKHSDSDIVVINDGSEDRTRENAREAGVRVISHPFNMGYGVALQTGYKYAVKKGYDFLVQMDGDGQHDPKYIQELFRMVESGESDIVIGSRFLQESDYDAGVLKKTGINIFRFMIRLISGRKITDPTSGYQCLSRKVFEILTGDLFPSDYPDADMIIMLHRMGFTIKEVPVTMIPNREGRSMHQGFFTVLYYFFKMFLSFFIALRREK